MVNCVLFYILECAVMISMFSMWRIVDFVYTSLLIYLKLSGNDTKNVIKL